MRLFFKQLTNRLISYFIRISGKPNVSDTFGGKNNLSAGNHSLQNENFLQQLIELAGLNTDQDVLEIGCGSGQMALPLLGYFSEKGSYNGFDSDKNGIYFCNKNIAAHHPDFTFQFIENDHYRSNFILPYSEKQFDFVFLTSAFTRLMPPQIEQYINEISRVMKTGALCVMSLFIINCESEDLIIKKPAHMNFPLNKGFYRLQNAPYNSPIVAYDEEWLLIKLESAGLKMETIKYGQWCGRTYYLEYLDLLICRKV